MKITVESTDKIIELRLPTGAVVPARLWQGATDSGVEVHCFITRIAAHEKADLSQFERELQSHAAPRPELAAIPLRLIL